MEQQDNYFRLIFLSTIKRHTAKEKVERIVIKIMELQVGCGCNRGIMKNRYMNRILWICILSQFVFFNACAKQTNRIDPHPAYKEAVEKLQVKLSQVVQVKVDDGSTFMMPDSMCASPERSSRCW